MSTDPWELLRQARNELDVLASYVGHPDTKWPTVGLMMTAVAQKKLRDRIEVALAEHESATPVVEWAYDVGNTQKAGFLDMELVIWPRVLHHLFKWSVTLTRNKVNYNTHGYSNTEAEAKSAAIAAARGLR
jgi:hypothetical protein